MLVSEAMPKYNKHSITYQQTHQKHQIT